MITFRKLIGIINLKPDSVQKSSLEQWFERVIDIPIEELSVEDLCRAIRQGLFIDQLMPRVLQVLEEEPLGGEYYDGELIAALATVKVEDLKGHMDCFEQAKMIINKINTSDIDNELRKDILKIGFPEVEKSGAIITGAGKAGFEGGTLIPPTKIDIIRPDKSTKG
ncbi:contact-dependent growth inhibition system immunity protein [Kluyvera genomosp. 2]|uniref:contact-dependent growth inhibition system immunity protein n=1 Tax=Kluyvera genomosp. 2 TaxID=2774054 RepID=UPI002FD7E08E